MTPSKRCTAPRCMHMADHARTALCEDHWREYRIRNALARRERKAAARRQMILTAIALLESEGYEVRKKSLNERTMP